MVELQEPMSDMGFPKDVIYEVLDRSGAKVNLEVIDGGEWSYPVGSMFPSVPRRVLVYLHGDPWFIDPHDPICPVCGQKVKVVW